MTQLYAQFDLTLARVTVDFSNNEGHLSGPQYVDSMQYSIQSIMSRPFLVGLFIFRNGVNSTLISPPEVYIKNPVDNVALTKLNNAVVIGQPGGWEIFPADIYDYDTGAYTRVEYNAITGHVTYLSQNSVGYTATDDDVVAIAAFSGLVSSTPTVAPITQVPVENGYDFQSSFDLPSYVWVPLSAVFIAANDRAESGSVSLVAVGPQTKAIGTIHFTDTNGLPSWTASNAASAITATETSGNTITLTPSQVGILEGDFHISPSSGNTSPNAISWSFTPSGNDLNFVKAGEKVTLSETVTVSDNGDSDAAAVTLTVDGAAPSELFTTGANVVDFNKLTPDQQFAIAAGAQTTDGLGGGDTVCPPPATSLLPTATETTRSPQDRATIRSRLMATAQTKLRLAPAQTT